MKSVQLLLVAAVLTSTSAAVPYNRPVSEQTQGQYSSKASELYFEQPIGHLNYINNLTWKQRLLLTGNSQA